MANTSLKQILNTVAGVRPSSTSPISINLKNNSKFEDLKDYSSFRPEDFQSNQGYHFRIIDMKKNSDATGASAISRFSLQINPQNLTQDEEFAIQITPTQQGVLAEHQGSVIKELTISGTTGVSPKAGLGGTTRDGIPRGSNGISGFEQFHLFRNFIAGYAEAKKNPNNNSLRMVFENPKDGDFFYVEPARFRKERRTPQKTLYFYTVVFKVLGRFVDLFDQDESQKVTGIFGKIKSASQTAVDYLADVEGTILASAELVASISRDFTDTIIAPLRSINSALGAFNQGVSIVVDIPRRTFVQLRNEVKTLKESLVELVGIDLSLYNSLTHRTSTVQNPLSETTYSHHELLNSFRNMDRGLNIVLSNSEFFGVTTLIDKGEPYSEQYEDGIELPSVSTAIQKTVLQGDTIHTISARELGTARRFKELIILNDLVPPYISTTSSTGVLSSGDTILIPSIGTDDPSNIILQNKEYPITLSLTNEERQLGIDLALDNDFDLILTNTSDFDVIGGKENAVQALRILLALQKGSLKLYPNIGTDLKIGEKLTDDKAFELQFDLIKTVLSSPKFSDAKFKIDIKGGCIEIDGETKLKNFNIGIPINLNIKA